MSKLRIVGAAALGIVAGIVMDQFNRHAVADCISKVDDPIITNLVNIAHGSSQKTLTPEIAQTMQDNIKIVNEKVSTRDNDISACSRTSFLKRYILQM